jgi:hypothetical protein
MSAIANFFHKIGNLFKKGSSPQNLVECAKADLAKVSFDVSTEALTEIQDILASANEKVKDVLASLAEKHQADIADSTQKCNAAKSVQPK